ncbi:uncharacterized protein LOC123293171 [Chrysoperla carnea]|uniref:uncharacterized protein LOC123293171 n=1 Tax=Chrysoperla carnea TaxID=189513 RepID=UPI001D08C1B5|nr:uncharacterized protein LOC123293171 [Chrysoperla carnea]XP_044729833.1 uncharacterized protein LOC123293171 [Chrysoperla carnea]
MAKENPDDPMGDNKAPFGFKLANLPVVVKTHYKKVLIAGVMGFVGYNAYLKMKEANTFSLFNKTKIMPMDSGTTSSPAKATQPPNLDPDPKMQALEKNKVLDDATVNTLQPFINDKTNDVSNILSESQSDDNQLDAEKMITEMINARDGINDDDKLEKAEISTVNDEKYTKSNDDHQDKIKFPIGRI